MATYPQEIQAKAINESLDNEWQGLFPDRHLRPHQKMTGHQDNQSTSYRPDPTPKSENGLQMVKQLRQER